MKKIILSLYLVLTLPAFATDETFDTYWPQKVTTDFALQMQQTALLNSIKTNTAVTNYTVIVTPGTWTNVTAILTPGTWTNVNATITGGSSSTTNFAYIVATNTITRTSGDYTTAYSPNDSICAGAGGATNPPITLAGALPTGCGKIIKLRCVTDSVTPIGAFRLWFYNSTNVTWNTDNAAHAVYYTNAATRLGYIDVTMAAGTAASYGMNIYDQLPIFNGTDTNIYCHVQTLNAFTPTAFTNLFIEATIQPSK